MMRGIKFIFKRSYSNTRKALSVKDFDNFALRIIQVPAGLLPVERGQPGLRVPPGLPLPPRREPVGRGRLAAARVVAHLRRLRHLRPDSVRGAPQAALPAETRVLHRWAGGTGAEARCGVQRGVIEKRIKKRKGQWKKRKEPNISFDLFNIRVSNCRVQVPTIL